MKKWVSFGREVSLKAIAIPLVSAVLAMGGMEIIAFAQVYDPMFLPASTNQRYVYCLNSQGQVVPYCDVNLFAFPYSNTGGHFHNSNRQASTVSPSSVNTGPSGNAPVSIITKLISQAEIIQFCAVGGSCHFFQYAVGYSNIYWNNHPEIWRHIGGNTTGHGDNQYNHWMELTSPSTGPAYELYYTTLQYLNSHQPQQRICTNDMALPFGGKFDVGATKWVSPHFEHDRGDAVDVAATTNQCTDANEIVNITEFLQACGSSLGHSPAVRLIDEGSHAHCGWRSPSSYPH